MGELKSMEAIAKNLLAISMVLYYFVNRVGKIEMKGWERWSQKCLVNF